MTMRTDTRSDLKKHCDEIADMLKAVSDGELVVDADGEAEGMYFDGLEEGDTVTMWDYLTTEDVFDIEYTIGSDGDFRGVRLMVACGGPNIYINTNSGKVEGYWWTDRADAWIPSEICDEINSVWEEYYNCTR